jgi:hypothetical protein
MRFIPQLFCPRKRTPRPLIPTLNYFKHKLNFADIFSNLKVTFFTSQSNKTIFPWLVLGPIVYPYSVFEVVSVSRAQQAVKEKNYIGYIRATSLITQNETLRLGQMCRMETYIFTDYTKRIALIC